MRPGSSRGELISSELIPLLDAANFLHHHAERALAPTTLGGQGRPAWLWGVETTIYREPLGRVLMLAPSNYPLFLPLVQAFHAWTAGNSFWLKSAPGSLVLHQRLKDLFLAAGGEGAVFHLLGEDNTNYQANLTKVDKVVLIGSAHTGRIVLSQAGSALVPCVAELSGWDSVFVHREADFQLAAQAVAFGLSLNRGKTCLAPRRIFVCGDYQRFQELLLDQLSKRPTFALDEREEQIVESSGATPLWAQSGHGPVVLTGLPDSHRLWHDESFGSLAVLGHLETEEQALALAKQCPFALGASLFGPEEWCRDFAHRVPAQVIFLNDSIVPSADPRVPFGGSGQSGFGRTRGTEGLLEMTRTRTVCSRQGGSLDHLLPPGPYDEEIVEQFMLMFHDQGWAARGRAFVRMMWGVVRERLRKRRLLSGSTDRAPAPTPPVATQVDQQSELLS